MKVVTEQWWLCLRCEVGLTHEEHRYELTRVNLLTEVV